MKSIAINKDSYTTQVVKVLEREIETGALPPLSKLQSTRKLAARFGVSKTVIMFALDLLEKRRLIHREERRGVFVSETASNPNVLEVLIFAFGTSPYQNSFVKRSLSVLGSEAAQGKINFYTRYATFSDQAKRDPVFRRRLLKAELAKLAQTFHSDCAIIIYPDLEKNDLLECLKLPFPTLFLGDFKEGDFPELSYNRIGSVINDFRDAVRFTRSREFHDLMLVLPDTLSGTVYFQNAIQEMEKKAEEQNVRIFYQWIPNARDCSKQVRLEGLKTAARRIRDSGMSSGLLFLDCVIYQEKFLEYLTAEGIVPRKGNLELLIGEAEEPDLYGEGIHFYRTQLESVAEFNRFLCDRLYDLAEGKLNNFHYNFNFQNQIRSWT